jgi:hypothetical protein
MDLKTGHLVQCTDNHYNQGLSMVNRIGMAVELRMSRLALKVTIWRTPEDR